MIVQLSHISALLHCYYTGTGKSVTGAHLAYASIIFNSGITPHQQSEPDKKKIRCVMYCGPSNKSVDVVMGKCTYMITLFIKIDIIVLCNVVITCAEM